MFHRLANGVIVFVCDECLATFETVEDFMRAWEMAKTVGWRPAMVGESVVFGTVLCRRCREKRR
jgi:hypothetical protein